MHDPILFFGILFIMITPLIVYFITGETMVLPLPLYIIGVNHNSHPGYEINYLWILMVAYMSAIGFSYTLALTFLYIGSVTCQIAILRLKIKDFENAIHLSALNHNETSLKIIFW